MFLVAPLDAAHDRTGFNSGSEPLDRYLREVVTQDIRRRVTACFIALASGQCIAGYYTLASASLLLADPPATTAKKLPRYPTVPVVRMGRLAVDQAFKGQGLGGALLADALDRAIRSEIAAYALMVDAKDGAAAAFYRHHGFVALPGLPLMLFLPLATAIASRKTDNKRFNPILPRQIAKDIGLALDALLKHR
ncbi:GNAT family N-acetyltransferase [Acidithiobacillus sp.]